MLDKPRILNRQIISETRIFRAEAIDLVFSNGIHMQYERLVANRGGAVLIVPLTDDETVLLIREYAAGSECYDLGLPKARIEEGEDILEAANREIIEEIGFGSHQLAQLTDLSLAPGYMNHRTHAVLVRDLYPYRLAGDEPEPIEVIPWPLNALDQLIQRDLQ